MRKTTREHGVEVTGKKSGKGQNHDDDFEKLYRDENVSLAVDVGEMAGITGKERGRQDEKKGDHFDVARSSSCRQFRER